MVEGKDEINILNMEYYICPKDKKIELLGDPQQGYRFKKDSGCDRIKKEWKYGKYLDNFPDTHYWGYYNAGNTSFTKVKQCVNNANDTSKELKYKFTSIVDSFGNFQSCSFEKYNG